MGTRGTSTTPYTSLLPSLVVCGGVLLAIQLVWSTYIPSVGIPTRGANTTTAPTTSS